MYSTLFGGSHPQWTWRDLNPDTAYVCRATIRAGYDDALQTPSDPIEAGIQCPTGKAEVDIGLRPGGRGDLDWWGWGFGLMGWGDLDWWGWGDLDWWGWGIWIGGDGGIWIGGGVLSTAQDPCPSSGVIFPKIGTHI